jgi:hypothetical protein
MSTRKDTIFVQIASYRDPECQWTVKDLFDQAEHPERLTVGICWQYIPAEDERCFTVSTRPEQVWIKDVDARESRGVCWARHEARELWAGETYTLQIDSHTRFVPAWDTRMIEQLAACRADRPMLSCDPAYYTPPDQLESDPQPTIRRAQPFSEAGDMRCRGEPLQTAPPSPLPGAFVSGGFMFSKSEVIGEVPYDPYLYFNQEEIVYALRLFTHGWDVFSPSEVLLYHWYASHAELPLHWTDNDNWQALQARALKRFNHLTGFERSTDPDVTAELNRYGLGKRRSLAEFERFSGVDFRTKQVSERAVHCLFVPERENYLARIVVPGTERADPPARRAASGTTRAGAGAPPGILVVEDYLDAGFCRQLIEYADAKAGSKLAVLDSSQTQPNETFVAEHGGRITEYVGISGVADQLLPVFIDVYAGRLAPFYGVTFEWFERPQILRYRPGGLYNHHADSENWVNDRWVRVQDRDFSILLYLNDQFSGGEIAFVDFDFKLKPKQGMLVAFPSDHHYQHAALPVTSGTRYVVVSWGAVLGTPRVSNAPPYAATLLNLPAEQ